MQAREKIPGRAFSRAGLAGLVSLKQDCDSRGRFLGQQPPVVTGVPFFACGSSIEP